MHYTYTKKPIKPLPAMPELIIIKLTVMNAKLIFRPAVVDMLTSDALAAMIRQHLEGLPIDGELSEFDKLIGNFLSDMDRIITDPEFTVAAFRRSILNYANAILSASVSPAIYSNYWRLLDSGIAAKLDIQFSVPIISRICLDANGAAVYADLTEPRANSKPKIQPNTIDHGTTITGNN